MPGSFAVAVAGSTQLNLSWTASTDPGSPSSGVAGYEITRNGTVLRTVGLVTSYQDTGLQPGTLYTYSLKAVDNAGLKSAKTSDVGATTTSISAVTYSYSLDGGAFIDNGATQNIALTGLVPGPHYVQLKRIDSSLGTSDISSYAWVTPANTPNPPTVVSATDGAGSTILGNGTTTSPDLTFALAGQAGTTLTVVLDNVSKGTVVSPYKATVAVGAHTIVFRSVSGGVSSAATTFTWTRTSSGSGPGSGTYQRLVTLAGGLPGINIPKQIWVRATDTGGIATVAIRNVILALPVGPPNPVSVSLDQPVDGSVFDSGIVSLLASADSSVTTVQATLDNVTFVSLAPVGGPVGGIQQWAGVINIPTDGSFAVINVIASDGVTTATDQSTVSFGTVVNAPTPGPGAPMIEVHPIVEFTVVHVDHGGADLGSIKPNSLTGSFPLNDAGSISYSIPFASPMARRNMCDPDLFDWRLERNGKPLFGGILDTAQIDTTTRNVALTGKTWEAYLSQRLMPFDPTANIQNQFKTYVNMDVLEMVRRLFDYVFGVSNSIPLTFSPDNSGIVFSNQFDPSAFNDMLTILQTLAEQQPGFDFDIDVNVRMNFYTPQKGGKS